MGGMRLNLHQEDAFFIEDVHFGVSAAMIIEKAQKLILQHDVSVILAFHSLNEVVAEEVFHFFNENRVFLIVSDTGGNLPPNVSGSPFVLINSLQTWKSNWAMGEFVAKELGTKIAFSVDLHDSGYNLDHLIRVGLDHYGSSNIFSQIAIQDIDLKPIEKAYQELEFDGLLANYNGGAGIDFLMKFQKSTLCNQVNLIVSPFLFEAIEAKDILNIPSVYTFHTWSEQFENSCNQRFVTNYTMKFGIAPNSFALLGFESSLILDKMRSHHLVENINLLSKLDIVTPRGSLKRSEFWNGLDASVYVLRKTCQDNEVDTQVVKQLADPVKMWDKIPQLKEEMQSGWLNPYLCA